ncbi:MAG TPA: flagellin FliC, partial [Halomonas sp.]|nr:flagellin FliC [Halomonas sp.]HBN59440.1 flagellin FliC [Halomonas sp.]
QSRIQDADYAQEVSNLIRAQLLQQVGIAMLTRVNQQPQMILRLLEGL